MHNLKSNFDLLKPIVKESLAYFIDSFGNIKKPAPNPSFMTLDLITISLIAECLSIDTENLLFSKLKHEYYNDFSNLIYRSQYNRRRKRLSAFIDLVRQDTGRATNKSQNCNKRGCFS